MEPLTFAVFALLPLGLLNWRRKPSDACFFGFLAPVIASGLSQLFKHKSESSAAKKQAEYEKQQAAQEEAQRKAQWEAQQASPQAVLQRQSFNMKLGKLLGKAGGRAKLPASMLAAYDAARAMPTYTPGSSYIEKPTTGGSIWDVLGGAGQALSYLDTTKIGKKAPMSPGQPVGGASTPTFQTGQLADYFKKKNPTFSSGTQDFG